MLFHPREPIGWGWFKIQGIFPKRQQQIAENLGKVVASELLSTNELKDKILKPDNIKAVHNSIALRLHQYLSEVLPKKYPVEKVDESVDIEAMVAEKVGNFPPSRLEDLLQKLLDKEFRFIEWIGAILGFIIGCLQLLLLYSQGQLPNFVLPF